MGNFLDNPKIDKDSDSLTSSTGLDMGATGMQGWRLEMEDEHIITDMPSLPDHSFVAVFDGHGGAGAAAYAKQHLVMTIEETKEWSDYKASGDTAALGEALTQAFLNIDDKIRDFQSSRPSDTSGCTSVTAMITPDWIVCANAGDSRCIIATNNTVDFLSVDHKPYDHNERLRIERAGGTVQYDRVDGDLAVSRALGDFHWKQRNDLKPSQQKVTCYPEIKVHKRSASDEVLLLACDGVWDVFTNEEVASLIYEILESGETSMKLLAEEIADLALDKGSRDNISVVAVRLPGARKASTETGGVIRRRADRANAQFNQYNPNPGSSPTAQGYYDVDDS